MTGKRALNFLPAAALIYMVICGCFPKPAAAIDLQRQIQKKAPPAEELPNSPTSQPAQKPDIRKDTLEKTPSAEQKPKAPTSQRGMKPAIKQDVTEEVPSVEQEPNPRKDMHLKTPAIRRGEIRRMRMVPRFACSVDRHSPYPWNETFWEASYEVRVRITNSINADNVKVVIEVQYWDDTFNRYSTYPDNVHETHEYTDYYAGGQQSILYKPRVNGAVAGCYADSQNVNKVNCKYRVVVDVTYKQDTDSSSPLVTGPWGQSSSGGWVNGADCEDVASWSVTQ